MIRPLGQSYMGPAFRLVSCSLRPVYKHHSVVTCECVRSAFVTVSLTVWGGTGRGSRTKIDPTALLGSGCAQRPRPDPGLQRWRGRGCAVVQKTHASHPHTPARVGEPRTHQKHTSMELWPPCSGKRHLGAG